MGLTNIPVSSFLRQKRWLQIEEGNVVARGIMVEVKVDRIKGKVVVVLLLVVVVGKFVEAVGALVVVLVVVVVVVAIVFVSRSLSGRLSPSLRMLF